MTDTQPSKWDITPDWDHWLTQLILSVDAAAWISLNIEPTLPACLNIGSRYLNYCRSGGDLQGPERSDIQDLHNACVHEMPDIFDSMYFRNSYAKQYFRRHVKNHPKGIGVALCEQFSFRLSFIFGKNQHPEISDKVRNLNISPSDFAEFCVEKQWPIPWRLAEWGGMLRPLDPKDIALALRRELWTLTETAHYLLGYAPYPDAQKKTQPIPHDPKVSEMERRVRDAIDAERLKSKANGTKVRPADVAAWVEKRGFSPDWLQEWHRHAESIELSPGLKQSAANVATALAMEAGCQIPDDHSSWDTPRLLQFIADTAAKAGKVPVSLHKNGPAVDRITKIMARQNLEPVKARSLSEILRHLRSVVPPKD